MPPFYYPAYPTPHFNPSTPPLTNSLLRYTTSQSQTHPSSPSLPLNPSSLLYYNIPPEKPHDRDLNLSKYYKWPEPNFHLVTNSNSPVHQIPKCGVRVPPTCIQSSSSSPFFHHPSDSMQASKNPSILPKAVVAQLYAVIHPTASNFPAFSQGT